MYNIILCVCYIYTCAQQSRGQNVCIYFEQASERERERIATLPPSTINQPAIDRVACFLRQLLWSLDTCKNNRFILASVCHPLYNENSRRISVHSRQVGMVRCPNHVYRYIVLLCYFKTIHGVCFITITSRIEP